jgi:hypothetical protein
LTSGSASLAETSPLPHTSPSAAPGRRTPSAQYETGMSPNDEVVLTTLPNWPIRGSLDANRLVTAGSHCGTSIRDTTCLPGMTGTVLATRVGHLAALALVSASLTVVGAGCGGGGSHSTTQLQIRLTYYPAGNATTKNFTLDCEPVRGTLPLATRVCQDIARHRKAMLNPRTTTPRSTCGGSPTMPQLVIDATDKGARTSFSGSPWWLAGRDAARDLLRCKPEACRVPIRNAGRPDPANYTHSARTGHVVVPPNSDSGPARHDAVRSARCCRPARLAHRSTPAAVERGTWLRDRVRRPVGAGVDRWRVGCYL